MKTREYTQSFKDAIAIQDKGLILNDFRVICYPTKCGYRFEWFNNTNYNSHSSLFSKSIEAADEEIDWETLKSFSTENDSKDTAVFGAFYALLGGNGAVPKLVIYGSSSDMPIRKINHVGMSLYHGAFYNLAYSNGWELIWMYGD